MNMFFSVDGGETFQPAPQGVRVTYEEVDVPGEDSLGQFHVNCTHEGLILDVWTNRNDQDHNIGTSSETVDEIVERLVECNV
jgi:hypothetical protein